MNEVLLREQYGDNYITKLPDGTVVPWRQLSLGEYIRYDRLLTSGYHANASIEDEIFDLCVLNPILVKERKSLDAGTVDLVVANIITYSGPNSLDELTYLLNLSRDISQGILHQIAMHVCQAFPAYKPEDVYDMNLITLMLRLAQAEERLMKAGLLSEPLQFVDRNNTEEVEQEEVPQQPQRSRLNQPHPNLKEEFEKRQAPQQSQQTVITSQDMQESTAVYTGHEAEDRVLLEHKMTNETKSLPHIQEYLKQLQDKGSVTIKSEEDRVHEAEERAKKHQLFIEKVGKEKSIKEKENLQKLAEELKNKTIGKSKKRKRGLRRG